MRTLERIKLQYFEGINESEQKGMKGGDGNWEWSDEFGTYMLPEVYVYGDKPNTYTNMQACPACQAYAKAHNTTGMADNDFGASYDALNTIFHFAGVHELMNGGKK